MRKVSVGMGKVSVRGKKWLATGRFSRPWQIECMFGLTDVQKATSGTPDVVEPVNLAWKD